MKKQMFQWSIRFTHIRGYSAPTMYIVSDEKYSQVIQIAKSKSRLGDFPESWMIEVLDKEEYPFKKPKKKFEAV